MGIPEVSVLMPVSGSGRFLKESMESVLSMQGVDFELVVADNGMDAQAESMIRSFTKNDERIRVVFEHAPGIASALNTGLTHCRGNLIARMDDDDICLPGRLSEQAALLRGNPQIGLVSGRVAFRNMDSPAEGMKAYLQRINSWVLEEEMQINRFVESPFAHPSVMFRKKLISEYGSYSTGPIPEDYELWLRWFSKGVRMQKLRSEVIVWRDHEGRLSRSHPNYSRNAFNTVRMKYLADWLHGQQINVPLWIWGGGKIARRNAKLLAMHGISVKGFIDVRHDRIIPGFEVRHYTNLPPPGSSFIVSMVSNQGKYREVESWLIKHGFHRGTTYIMAGCELKYHFGFIIYLS